MADDEIPVATYYYFVNLKLFQIGMVICKFLGFRPWWPALGVVAKGSYVSPLIVYFLWFIQRTYKLKRFFRISVWMTKNFNERTTIFLRIRMHMPFKTPCCLHLCYLFPLVCFNRVFLRRLITESFHWPYLFSVCYFELHIFFSFEEGWGQETPVSIYALCKSFIYLVMSHN